MKKLLIVLLILALSTGAAFAALAFSDVATNYWGYTYIQEAAEAGIVEGFYSGKKLMFAPTRDVTKQETATMLYGAMRAAGVLGGEDDYSGEYAELLKSANVASWANTFVSYGFKKNFILPSDLTTGSDATKAAPREMLGVWCAKAMNYELSPLAVLSYADTANISASAMPYVDALYRHDIMTGATGNKFNPANGITRVEMATVAVRLMNDVKRMNAASSKTVSEVLALKYGTVEAVNESRRTVLLKNGNDSYTLRIDDYASIILNGRSVDFAELASLKGSTASLSCVIGEGNTVLVKTGPVVEKGSIESVSELSDGKIVVIKTSAGSIPYIIDGNTQYGSLKSGTSVSYISDGALLLELN